VVDRPFWRTIATAGGSGLWLNASRHDDDDDDDDDDDA